MVETTPPCARRASALHAATNYAGWGMPGGGARAAGGEPVGTPTQRGGGCLSAPNPASASSPGRETLPHMAGPLLWYAYAYHGRESRIGTMVALSTRPVSLRRC